MEIKDRIKQKSDELFRTYGIRSITMDEIATKLGMSKKTIYQFFVDKDELVDAVTEDELKFSKSCCDENRNLSTNAIDEIFRTMEFVEKMFRNMNPAMIYDLEKYHPNGYKKFLEHKNKYLLQLIRCNLERGIREELYRPEINVEIMSKFRLESLMIAFNTSVFPASKYNLAELQHQIIEHFLFGISSLKGYKLILKYQQERIKKSKPI
jgi:TetR/AcrR family transcriptional regulator, cholesterol catabolism regulator